MQAGSTATARIVAVIGLALWLGSGFAAWAGARIVPADRSRPWALELTASLGAALLAGVGATAIDFGGWNEADWRAGLFAFLCGLAAAGLVRRLRMTS